MILPNWLCFDGVKYQNAPQIICGSGLIHVLANFVSHFVISTFIVYSFFLILG